MRHNGSAFLAIARQEFDALLAAGIVEDKLQDAGQFLCDYIESAKGSSDVTARGTRIERFRKKHKIGPTLWAAKAGLKRQSLDRVREGSDAHIPTIRAIVRGASEILGRQVHVSELFDIGEDSPVPVNLPERRIASETQRKTLKRYPSRIDRILRGEGIMPNEFADRVGIGRQSLLRFRAGQDEPCLSTLARIVNTLRLMTGKPYLASHLYDVGEGLRNLQSGR